MKTKSEILLVFSYVFFSTDVIELNYTIWKNDCATFNIIISYDFITVFIIKKRSAVKLYFHLITWLNFDPHDDEFLLLNHSFIKKKKILILKLGFRKEYDRKLNLKIKFYAIKIFSSRSKSGFMDWKITKKTYNEKNSKLE